MDVTAEISHVLDAFVNSDFILLQYIFLTKCSFGLQESVMANFVGTVIELGYSK